MKLYPYQTVQAVAVIAERIADTAFRATLPNGKTTVAFVEKKNAPLRDVLKPGDRVAGYTQNVFQEPCGLCEACLAGDWDH